MAGKQSSLEYAQSKYFFRALINVYECYKSTGKQPGAERWVMDTRQSRAKLLRDVVDEWCKITGFDRYLFPFHEDFMVHAWTEYRKHSDKPKLRLSWLA